MRALRKGLKIRMAMAACVPLAVLVSLVVMAAVVVAEDSSQQALRGRMEQAMFDGRISIAGVDLAATELMVELYSAREFRAAWNDRAKIEQLYLLADRAVAEGLDRSDYPFAAIEALLPASGLPEEPRTRVDLDILATETLIRIAYQLRFGKLNPNRLFANWNFDRSIVREGTPAEIMQRVINAPSIPDYAASARLGSM